MYSENSDPYFTDTNEPEEPRCSHCGFLTAEHLYTHRSGDKDWRCPEPEPADWTGLGTAWPGSENEAAGWEYEFAHGEILSV